MAKSDELYSAGLLTHTRSIFAPLWWQDQAPTPEMSSERTYCTCTLLNYNTGYSLSYSSTPTRAWAFEPGG